MLGEEFSKVREFLETFPFPAALALLERSWEHKANKPEFNMAALACIAASGLLGVFGSSRLFEMAAACLAFEKEFLVVGSGRALFQNQRDCIPRRHRNLDGCPVCLHEGSG